MVSYDNLIASIRKNELTSIDLSFIRENLYNLLWYFCNDGYLGLAKWIYNFAKIEMPNTNIDISNMFRTLCRYGKKEAAEWIYNLSLVENIKIDVRECNDYAFKYSCIKGHKDVAEWLCTIDTNFMIIYNDGKMQYKISDS